MENSKDSAEQIHKNRSKLGKLLLEFEGRILNGIRLDIDKSSGNPSRYTYRFVKVADEVKEAKSGAESPKPAETSPPSCNPVSLCNPPEARTRKRETIQNEDNELNLDVKPVSIAGGWRATDPYRVTGDFLAIDLETYADVTVKGAKKPKIKLSGGALHPWSGDIRLLTVTDIDGNLQQYDLRNKLSDSPLPIEIIAALKHSPLIIHNAGFDLLFLTSKLKIFSDRVFCTLTASRLLSGSRTVKHDLAAVLERYLGITLTKEHGASDWGTMLLSPEQLEYAEDDVRYLHPLQEKLETELEAAGLSRVFQMEMALLPVVVAMEHYGFAVDAEKLKAFGDQMRKEADADAASLRLQLSSPKLNVDSTQQLAEAFTTIGVDLEATNKDVLTALDHPLAKLVLEYRRKDNLAGKAVSLLKHVRTDGRIHARFNSLGAETGRFSSAKPNLQQVPRTAGAREPFVASGPDRKLIIADASQVELRRAAGVSNDQKMIAAFRANEDLHRKTAAAVLQKKVQDVTKHDRTLAKSVNFGFIYGQGADGYRRYAKTDYGIDVEPEQAVKLRSAFFKTYPGLAAWHADAWRKAEAGEAEARTVMGRRLIARKDDTWSRFNVWTNFVIQGDCAEYQKMCMINVARVLPSDAHLVATVHDELIYDVPADQAEMLCTMIRMAMEESWHPLFGEEVPIKIDAKVCDNWAEKG